MLSSCWRLSVRPAAAPATKQQLVLMMANVPGAQVVTLALLDVLHSVMCDTTMCPHSQGAALGAAHDVVHSAHIFVAIQAHKGLTAFALGCSLVESAAPPLQFWSLVRSPLLMASVAAALFTQWCGAVSAVRDQHTWRHVCMLFK